MDLRTFRTNGRGRAAYEAEAAWLRLWATIRRSGPPDPGGPVATSWPQFGYSHRQLMSRLPENDKAALDELDMFQKDVGTVLPGACNGR
jgi:hypothetical protein